MKVAVVGAGIIGVSSGYQVKLAYPNAEVVIYAETFTPDTTSDGAAGYLIPLDDKGTPRALIKKWSKITLDYVDQLLATSEDASMMGLSSVHGYELFEEENVKPSDWVDVVHDHHIITKNDLRRFPSAVKTGFCFSTVCIESSLYVPWLMKKFQHLGGKIVKKRISMLSELVDYEIVINCTGLSARELVPDNKVFPIRGQVVRVKAPWVKEFYSFFPGNGMATLILPNQNSVVLGGTFAIGDENLTVNEDDKQRILQNAIKLIPSLKNAEFLLDWVGLRPGRYGVRLDLESTNDGRNIIHNYGHSASGITLHWGCAETVVELVKQCVSTL